MELDRVPLWRGNHVAVRQLVEDFGRYLYLPRLQTPDVLLDAIRSGLALLTWEQDAFAYADGYDEAAARYRSLRYSTSVGLARDDTGLLVKPEAARKQIEQETAPPVLTGGGTSTGTTIKPGGLPVTTIAPPGSVQPPKPRRYHGTVVLDPARVGRDAGRIADEVITHLVGLVGSSVHVTLEIDAEIPAGAPDNVVRAVTENCRTLKFKTHGFEEK
jgi:hypothetical protein